MKINKKFILLTASTFLFLHFTQTTFAHVLKTDNTIGAILHIDPEDEPIAGEPSNLFFVLKDKKNHFATKNCECTITIKQNETIIKRQTITADPKNQTTIIFTYTFPKKDIYQVIMSGTPKQRNTFQRFSLTYDIRVAREKKEKNNTQTTPLLMIIIGSIIGCALLIIFWKK